MYSQWDESFWEMISLYSSLSSDRDTLCGILLFQNCLDASDRNSTLPKLGQRNNFLFDQWYNLYDAKSFKLIYTYFMAQNIIYFSKCSRASEKNGYFVFVDGEILKISSRSIWLITFLNYSTSLVDTLLPWITVWRLLKYPMWTSGYFYFSLYLYYFWL